MTLYVILKWLHILLAITALGTNLTYGIWLARAAREHAALPFTLRGIQILDERVANPAYGLLLVSGFAMVYVGEWSLTTPWILISLALFVATVLVGALGYSRTLREQIRLAEAGSAATQEYADLAQRGLRLGIVLAVLVIAITFFMVTKPAL